MKFKNSSKIIFIILAMAAIALIAFACNNSKPSNSPANSTVKTTSSTNPAPDKKPPTMTDYPVGNAPTPTEAYRMLFAAVKSQETAKIKSMYSKASMGLAEMQAGRSNQPIEKVLENGFSETTFVDDFPQMRDERVNGNFGAVEVWNEKSKKWDDVPFVLEDGGWKLAFGDQFAGTFKSPGKSQGQIEAENANASNPNAMIPMKPNSNQTGNFPSGGKVTKPQNQ